MDGKLLRLARLCSSTICLLLGGAGNLIGLYLLQDYKINITFFYIAGEVTLYCMNP